MYQVRMMFLILILILGSGCNAIKYQMKKDNDEATQKCKTAKIYAQLGIAYLERNNIQRAKQKLLLALELGPTIPEPWYSMGYFLEATGDKQQAEEYYVKAITVAPKRGDAQNNYGTYLCRSGKYREAIDRFLLAVKDPEYLDGADAYENAGLCALQIPNRNLAMDYFKQALHQDPNRPVALLNMAQLYYKKENYKFAKIKLDQYAAIAPATQSSMLLKIKIDKGLADQIARRKEIKEKERLFVQQIPTFRPEKLQNEFKALSLQRRFREHANKKYAARNIKELREKFLKPQKIKIINTVAPSQSPPVVVNHVKTKVIPKSFSKSNERITKAVLSLQTTPSFKNDSRFPIKTLAEVNHSTKLRSMLLAQQKTHENDNKSTEKNKNKSKQKPPPVVHQVERRFLKKPAPLLIANKVKQNLKKKIAKTTLPTKHTIVVAKQNKTITKSKHANKRHKKYEA